MNPEPDPLEEALATWLAGTSVAAVENPMPPALGYTSTQRAIAEAQSHVGCPADHRTKDYWFRVVGTDGANTLQVIPVGVNINCVFRAWVEDEDTAFVGFVGTDPFHDEPEPEVVELPDEPDTPEAPPAAA